MDTFPERNVNSVWMMNLRATRNFFSAERNFAALPTTDDQKEAGGWGAFSVVSQTFLGWALADKAFGGNCPLSCLLYKQNDHRLCTAKLFSQLSVPRVATARSIVEWLLCLWGLI